MQAKLLGGKDHQQRLAAALEMPDESLLWIALDHSGDDLVGGLVLLITADDLDAAVFLVGGKEGEVLKRCPARPLDAACFALWL